MGPIIQRDALSDNPGFAGCGAGAGSVLPRFVNMKNAPTVMAMVAIIIGILALIPLHFGATDWKLFTVIVGASTVSAPMTNGGFVLSGPTVPPGPTNVEIVDYH